MLKFLPFVLRHLRRELGTMRALGFSRRAILASFVLESALLALIGGSLGCLLAFAANGYTTGASL